jgi:hypothetical protein
MTFRVRDLKTALEDLPDEAIIILQVDEATTGLDIVTLVEPVGGVPEVVLS